MINNKKVILVTSGEPGGIGPDICLDLVNYKLPQSHLIVVIADRNILIARAKLLNREITFVDVDAYQGQQNSLIVYHIPCQKIDTIGGLKIENASYVISMLETAINLCKNKLTNIIVTAPVNKEILNMAGYNFSGHTEYFAEKFNCAKVVMMFKSTKLTIALLTTHVALKDVPSHVTTDNLTATLNIIIKHFKDKYSINNPKIGVCGLNPHAGEGGFIGREEIEIINPVIKKFKQQGSNVMGSFSADTIFNQNFDIILALYHDQALPVLKYSDFENGVNITLGLPITRTSVDHGTALNIAGTGLASSKSLFHAIDCAL